MKRIIVIISLLTSGFALAKPQKKQLVKKNYDLTYQQAYKGGSGFYGYSKNEPTYSGTYSKSKKVMARKSRNKSPVKKK